MRIDSYDFGKIVINGKMFTSDVIVFPDHIEDNWWRDRGHSLSRNDIDSILRAKPEILVIGTGKYGVMEVPENVKNIAESRGIKLIVYPTEDACEHYNELLSKGKFVICAMHLTC
jgi:hypothetical protein